MTEPEHDAENEHELAEPDVADVPEPDQPLDGDLTDEEAEEAESGAHEPTDAPEAQAQSAFDNEQARKKVEASFVTYTKALGKNYEEEANELIRCPLCPDNFPGFVHPNDFGRYPEESKVVIMEVLGVAREQDYEPDPYAHVCPTCKGKTRTATGSQSNEYRTRLCPDCKGIGYKDQRETQANGSVRPPSAQGDATQAVTDITIGERDNWGEPRILPDGSRNENYGLMPQYKRPHPVYGITALIGSEQGVS